MQQLETLQQQNPNMHFFLPSLPDMQLLNHLLQPVGPAPPNLGNCEMEVKSNAGAVATRARHIVEQSFSRVANQSLSGIRTPLDRHFKEAAGQLYILDLRTSAAAIFLNPVQKSTACV